MQNLFLDKRVGKRGISPLIATVLLVAFAVSLGAVVMNWASGADEAETELAAPSGCIVSAPITEPLQQLMVNYLNNKIDKQQFFSQVEQYK